MVNIEEFMKKGTKIPRKKKERVKIKAEVSKKTPTHKKKTKEAMVKAICDDTGLERDDVKSVLESLEYIASKDTKA